MARRDASRVTPEIPAFPAETPQPAGRRRSPLQPASGGGRRRGAGDPGPAALAARELWIAVYLPRYMLESLCSPFPGASAHAASPEATAAVAVVDLERGAKVVCDCDAIAAAAGVAPGMALNSALALLPALQVCARDRIRERALLESVAALALGFSPRVGIEPPDGVLLEVRGSLKLFGGARRLCALLREKLETHGLEPRLALTPTPLAAAWFARAGQEVALRRGDALPARLAPLPLAVTRWPERALQSLSTMGVRTLGECLRLPRDGLARRFEPRLRLDLDRALGLAADPRAAFVARERFVARRDIEPETADTARLQLVIEPLLAQLCAFLRARGGAIEALGLTLQHREAPATRLRLGFAEPVAAEARIAALLRERLSRVALPEAVRSVRLRGGPLVTARVEADDLFASGRRATAVPQLVERLRARLGAQAVHGLCIVPEHRPEKNGDIPVFSGNGDIHRFSEVASVVRTPSPKIGECPHFPRPVWLLAEPQPLEGGEQPHCEGVLELEDGPERIESGWWDGHDVRRDYYVARNPAGVRLWIFRERRAQGRWFLHGVFG
jgi:protein ImuB